MASTNKKTNTDHRIEKDIKLAGGHGMAAAKQNAEALLRRSVMACLLWEDMAYLSGDKSANNIASLIPQVDPAIVAQIAIDCRNEQKLRHIPLYIVSEMAKHETHKPFVKTTLTEVIQRPDELSEFLSIYWKNGKVPIANSIKKGLASAFTKFNEYQLAKWNRDNDIRLRDVLFLCHAKPKDEAQDSLWKKLIDNKLDTPDTWEVGISACVTNDEKKAVWTRLLKDNKLGALALLKNLRNLEQTGVDRQLVHDALENANPSMLLPINFMSAAKYAPRYLKSIEKLMMKCVAEWPKLAGYTIFVVDVSGSMGRSISNKSEFTRLDVAAGMTVLASGMCESYAIYATGGTDSRRKHNTGLVPAYSGFALSEHILNANRKLGYGGIFTKQCLDYIEQQETSTPDRIIVFSDSQDCDMYYNKNAPMPTPFGKNNYIIDVSAEKHGINYNGVWTAEISGWSESFLKYIHAYETFPLN